MADQITTRGLPVPIDSLGRYRLVAKLGHGGMGTVHLGVVSGLGNFKKLVVVKELRADQGFADLLRQENLDTMPRALDARLAGRST